MTRGPLPDYPAVPAVGLSLTQPWATLLATREKRYETRSWRPKTQAPHPTEPRGPIPLAIHASATFPQECKRLCGAAPFYHALTRHGFYRWHDHALGAIIATGYIQGVWPTEAVRGGLHDVEAAFGDYGNGRWAWRIVGVTRLLAPIPATGSLGLWPLAPATREELGRALALVERRPAPAAVFVHDVPWGLPE